jgi:sensor c-di-GMP phosphodiesterase-like protein
MGCDHAQGFYYSRPVPAADFEAWVVETQARQAAGGGLVALADARRVA